MSGESRQEHESTPNATELARRFRRPHGYVPSWLAADLLARGQEEEVRRQARLGEWECAEQLAVWLAGRGQVNAALDELRPYVVTGWPRAVCSAASLLDRADRPVEALEWLRRYADTDASVQVLTLTARVLAASGRLDDAIAMLAPRLAQPAFASTLVDVTSGQGRDDRVEALLRDQVERPASDQGAHAVSHALVLLATVLERRDRADEAIALLAQHVDSGHGVTQNEIDHLAWLLQREGAENRLRALAAGRGGPRAAAALVRLLVEADRDQEAEELLRSQAAEGPTVRSAKPYAEFLVARGRTDDALEMLRPRLMEKDDLDGVARWIAGVLVTEGRADEAIALYDDMARSYEPRFETFREWVFLLLSIGRAETAVEEARAYTVKDPLDGPEFLGEVLCEAGRFDEGFAVAQALGDADSMLLTNLLVGMGEFAQALAVAKGSSAGGHESP